VGLGGVYYGGFLQTGTTAAANGSDWAWIEMYSANYASGQYVIPNFSVYAQDYMQFYVGYDWAAKMSYF
jgi:hypothetical protein